jgi:hypothetical protein
MACGHHKNHQNEAGDRSVRCEFTALKKHRIPALIIFIKGCRLSIISKSTTLVHILCRFVMVL